MADDANSRSSLIFTLVVLVLGASGWGYITHTRSHQVEHPATELPEEWSIQRMAARTGDPAKMITQYEAALERPEFNEAQRRQLRDNIRRAREVRMNLRVDEYFATPADERPALIDRHLDQMLVYMEQRRAERENRPMKRPAGVSDEAWEAGSSVPATNPAANSTASAGVMRTEWPDTPERQAQREEYFEAVRRRAEERKTELPWGLGRR